MRPLIIIALVCALLAPAAAHADTAATNQKIAWHQVHDRGWPESSYGCLKVLWHRESGWNHRARNPQSGAYGIPQALPASKLRSAGKAIHTAVVQIRWGLTYIAARYGGPCRAWAFWLRHRWY